MKKAIYISVMCLNLLLGREDPFELKMTPKKSPQSVEGEISQPLESLDVKLPSTTRILKEVKFIYQKIDGSIGEKSVKIERDIDWHYPITISQIGDKSIIEEKKPMSYTLGDFEFIIIGKSIRIYSPYKILQNFVLPKPFRIIIDLRRTEKIINQDIKLKGRFFTDISLGTHQDFYRVTLALDGQYGYNIEQDEKGYIITLK
ncbi:AMIN domain-containing protein [Helicobacter cholecystus]|uniref:AMIN domain-containing protein n=1 Tax=Helicobacter cholecystus TaxID=45498 RepID=A0A3D8IVX5_9HELI|nr:AMIN domain-containing protein [Helicobacter cholecystus]RDU69427.1 AMIN domain-containing protein [Helicobacter cholecystus]VEJ23975.1 periplasmic protein [Helicobacter cholecystus]